MTAVLTIRATDGQNDGLPTIVVDDTTLATTGYCIDYSTQLGDAETITERIESLLFDGDRVRSSRYGNREVQLPVHIAGASRTALATRTEQLILAISRETFEVLWQPVGRPAVVLDCYRPQARTDRDLVQDDFLVRTVDLNFEAGPFLRAGVDTTLNGTIETGSSNSRVINTTGVTGSAPGRLTDARVTKPSGSLMLSWLLHCSPPMKTPPGARLITQARQAIFVGVPEGDYTVLVARAGTNAPQPTGNVSVSARQFNGNGSSPQTAPVLLGTRTYPAGAFDFPDYVAVAAVSLPMVRTAEEDIEYHFDVVDNGLLWTELLLVDTAGTTIIVPRTESAQGYVQRDGIVLPATMRTPINQVLGYAGRVTDGTAQTAENAYYLPGQQHSGPPLAAHPRGNTLLAHSPYGTPTLTASYEPAWLSDRPT